MRKFALTIVMMMVYTTITIAQNSKLDEKNGFNIFQLESELSDIKKIAKLKAIKSSDQLTETYIVQSIDKYQILGYPIKAIQLTFYKKRLLEISLYMPDIDASPGSKSRAMSMDVVDKIASEYGAWTTLDKTSQEEIYNVVATSMIQSSKVTLLMNQYGLTYVEDKPMAQGNRYAFISTELYNLKERDPGKQSGL
jgi:hypothetical protein